MRCIPIFIVQPCFYEAVLSALQFGFISAMAGHFIGLNPFSLWVIIAIPLNAQCVPLFWVLFCFREEWSTEFKGSWQSTLRAPAPCVTVCLKYNTRINIFPSALLQHVHMPAVCSLFCPTCLLLVLE